MNAPHSIQLSKNFREYFPSFVMRLSLAGAILFLLPGNSQAQKKYFLQLKPDSQSEDVLHEKAWKKISQKNVDSLQCLKEINRMVSSLQSGGYLAAGVDSIHFADDTCKAVIHSGNSFRWMELRRGNVEEVFLRGTGYRQKSFAGRTFNPEEFGALREKIIENCENNGYPFAGLNLDSTTVTDSTLRASLHLSKNRFTKIDSVVVRNKDVIAPVYMYNYLGIKPGDPYNESQVRKITLRMKELSFAKESSPARILFTDQYTKLELNLEGKHSSQFDGIIGLLPNSGNEGKTTLTGEVHLKLQNSFRRGEIIDLNWRALPSQSQDLKLRFYYPFLFNTPFGMDLFLGVYKKDTSYIDVDRLIGVQYQLSGNNFLKAFLNIKESNLVSTAGLENITTLPPYADMDLTAYGLTFHYELLDYRINPHKGYLLDVTGSTGNRTIRRNPDVNPAVYDSIELISSRYKVNLLLESFLPLASRHVLNAGLLSGTQTGEGTFDNELFRLGGLKTLRGFDDESILASSFVIGKLEYRYILELNSYLFAFYNAAWYKKKTNSGSTSDTPQGFGTGIAFETKLGIMSVTYALGKEFSNPIQFRNAKIHFGIINYF